MARPRVQIDGHLLLRGYWIVRTYENLVDKEAVHLERRLSRIENDLDETANGRTQQKAANPGDDGDAAARKAMQNQELPGSAAQRPDCTEGDDAARADLQNQNNDDRTGEEDTERLNSGAVADHDQDAQSTQTTEVPDLPYPIEPYETKNINDPDPRPSLRNGRQRFSSVDQDAAKGANRKKGKSSVDKTAEPLQPPNSRTRGGHARPGTGRKGGRTSRVLSIDSDRNVNVGDADSRRASKRAVVEVEEDEDEDEDGSANKRPRRKKKMTTALSSVDEGIERDPNEAGEESEEEYGPQGNIRDAKPVPSKKEKRNRGTQKPQKKSKKQPE